MFYSNDLLTLRGGGKFNLIWLLSTTSDRLSLARKRKADLLSLNYKTIVEELQKLFPVTGKKTSLSLRTSAVLMHGVFISFKLRVDILNNDTIKLLGTTTRVKGRGTIDNTAVTTSKKTDLALEEHLDLTRFGDVKEVADNFQELNLEPAEITARQRAITMVEVDLPQRIEDEWSFSNGTDQLMVPNLDALEEMRTIFDAPMASNDVVPTESMEVDDNRDPEEALRSILNPGGQNDVSSYIAAPPVKPRIGSNPRIEVTPAITEERPSRISPVHNIPEQLNMDVDDTNLGNDVFRPPNLEGELQPDVQIPDVMVTEIPDDVAAPIAHPPETDDPVEVRRGESPSMELSPVRNVSKKRKRKALCIHVDEETQIPGDQIKAQMQDYNNLLRPKEGDTARILRPRVVNGHKVVYPRNIAGKSFISLFKEAEQAGAKTEGHYDWEEDVQPPMNLGPVGPALEIPAQEVSEMRDDSLLRRESSFNESSILNPQGNLHSTMISQNDPSNAKPEEDTRMEVIPEDSVQTGQLQPPVDGPILSPSRRFEEDSNQIPVPSPQRNATFPEQEDDAVAIAPGNITSPTGYEEFSQGLSQRIPEASTIDEGFDETINTLAFGEALRTRIGGRKEGFFSNLVDADMDRRDVAKTFLQMLVSNKQEKVDVTQDNCYEEIKFQVL